jgi:peptide/nickel transport system substrate-binding protein
MNSHWQVYRRFLILLLGITIMIMAGAANQIAQAGERIPLTISVREAAKSMDPASGYGGVETIMAINTYDVLFYPELDATGTEIPKPRLATDVKVSKDGLVYTIKIREGVKFHDGKAVTAEDVAFSMDRTLRIKQGFVWLWLGTIEPGNTKAIDKYTVEFRLKAPSASFIASLTRLYIVNKDLLMSKKVVGSYGEFGDYGAKWLNEGHDAGSGAYKLASWEPRGKTVLTRNLEYWRGWRGGKHVDDLTIVVILEEATAKTMLMKGEIDMDDGWNSPSFYQQLKGVPGVAVEQRPWAQLQVISFNNKKPPYDDIHVRKAVSWAFDYQVPVKVQNPGSIQARGVIPKGTFGYNETLFQYSQDLEKARAELAKSKYSKEQLAKMKIEYVGMNAQKYLEPGLLLKDNLAKLGLTVEIVPTEWVNIVSRMAKPETAPHHVPWWNTLKVPDPDSYLSGWLTPASWGGFQGMCYYDNPTVTKLIADSVAVVDPAKRKSIIDEVQKLVVEDAPAILLTNTSFSLARREWVKGWTYVNSVNYCLEFYPVTVEK